MPRQWWSATRVLWRLQSLCCWSCRRPAFARKVCRTLDTSCPALSSGVPQKSDSRCSGDRFKQARSRARIRCQQRPSWWQAQQQCVPLARDTCSCEFWGRLAMCPGGLGWLCAALWGGLGVVLVPVWGGAGVAMAHGHVLRGARRAGGLDHMLLTTRAHTHTRRYHEHCLARRTQTTSTVRVSERLPSQEKLEGLWQTWHDTLWAPSPVDLQPGGSTRPFDQGETSCAQSVLHTPDASRGGGRSSSVCSLCATRAPVGFAAVS